MLEYWRKNLWENHVLVTVVVVFLAWLLFEIKSILISVFLAYILTATLAPTIEYLVAKRFSRPLAVILVYLLLLLGLTFIIFPLVPFIISQSRSFVDHFPLYLDRVNQLFGLNSDVDLATFIKNELDTLGKNAFFLTSKVFSGLFSLVTTIVISIYLLLDRERFQKTFINYKEILAALDTKLGSWVRGQLSLSLAVGFSSWLGLIVLGVPFALPLAIIAGILELVPLIGPVLSAVPAVIVAMTISPALGLLTVGLYIVVQLLENNILVPKVMQQAVGLNPVVVILGITIGGKLLGILGAVLAIPVIITVTTIIQTRKKSV